MEWNISKIIHVLYKYKNIKKAPEISPFFFNVTMPINQQKSNQNNGPCKYHIIQSFKTPYPQSHHDQTEQLFQFPSSSLHTNPQLFNNYLLTPILWKRSPPLADCEICAWSLNMSQSVTGVLLSMSIVNNFWLNLLVVFDLWKQQAIHLL